MLAVQAGWGGHEISAFDHLRVVGRGYFFRLRGKMRSREEEEQQERKREGERERKEGLSFAIRGGSGKDDYSLCCILACRLGLPDFVASLASLAVCGVCCDAT